MDHGEVSSEFKRVINYNFNTNGFTYTVIATENQMI